MIRYTATRFREWWMRERGFVDERDDEAYETPPEAVPTPEETEEARESMTRGLPVLLGAVFVTVVAVTVLILLLR